MKTSKRSRKTTGKKDIFANLETANGSLSEATAEGDLLLPCDEYFITEDKAFIYTIRKLGGKEGLKRCTRQTAMMTHTLGFPQENGEYAYITREVYYSIE